MENHNEDGCLNGPPLPTGWREGGAPPPPTTGEKSGKRGGGGEGPVEVMGLWEKGRPLDYCD